MRVGKPYGSWICHSCGLKYGTAVVGRCSTVHLGTCDWCGRDRWYVTEPRDYGYPRMPND